MTRVALDDKQDWAAATVRRLHPRRHLARVERIDPRVVVAADEQDGRVLHPFANAVIRRVFIQVPELGRIIGASVLLGSIVPWGLNDDGTTRVALWRSNGRTRGMHSVRQALRSLRRTLEPDLQPFQTSSYMVTHGGNCAEALRACVEYEAVLRQDPAGLPSDRMAELRNRLKVSAHDRSVRANRLTDPDDGQNGPSRSARAFRPRPKSPGRSVNGF